MNPCYWADRAIGWPAVESRFPFAWERWGRRELRDEHRSALQPSGVFLTSSAWQGVPVQKLSAACLGSKAPSKAVSEAQRRG